MKPRCRHCQRRKVNRPRGLCFTCYYSPGVRALWPITSKYARRGVLDFNGGYRLDDTPTNAAPGSIEKIGVMRDRIRRRVSLFHPLDAEYSAESARIAANLMGFVIETPAVEESDDE